MDSVSTLVGDAPRVGPIAAASAAFASVAFHTFLFGCGCGCFTTTRHAAFLAVPTLVAASAWYGIVTGGIALLQLEDAVIAGHDLAVDAVNTVNAAAACLQSLDLEAIKDVQSSAENVQSLAVTAIDVIVVVREYVELGMHALVGCVVILFATTSLVRYALPVFPLVVCSGAPAIVSGLVGTTFIFVHGLLLSGCDTLQKDAADNDEFSELVLGERGSITDEIDRVVAAAEAAGQGDVCVAEVANLRRSIAPGVLGDVYDDVNSAACDYFAVSLLYIGMPLVGAACAPFVADVVGVIFRTSATTAKPAVAYTKV